MGSRQLEIVWDRWVQSSNESALAPARRRRANPPQKYPAPAPAPRVTPRVTDTSGAARKSVAGVVGKIGQKVLAAIICAGDRGRTCDEVVSILGLRHQTASARFRELAQSNLIRDTGKRRKTSSGRTAAVWEVDRARLIEGLQDKFNALPRKGTPPQDGSKAGEGPEARQIEPAQVDGVDSCQTEGPGGDASPCGVPSGGAGAERRAL